MRRTYSLQEARCFIPWRADAARFKIRLLERAASPLPEPIGIWEFGLLDGTIEGLEIDLLRLDAYSVHLRAPARQYLAQSHWQANQPSVSGRLGLEVMRVEADSAEQIVFQAELILPEAELAAAKQRLKRDRVPPIEWFFVEMTNRCNFRCAWCPKRRMSRPQGAMPLDRAQWLLGEIAAYRKRHPIFSLYAEIRNAVFLHMMGEPLQHPNLFEIIRYGREQGLDFCLVTNASLLKAETVDRVLDSGLSAIVLSLNAPDAAAFAPTGAPIDYERLVTQIQYLIAERYRRGMATPRIEIQLLNSTGVAVPECRMMETPEQVEAQLAFWSSFVRDQERATGAAHGPMDLHAPLRRHAVLDRHEANDPDTYFPLGQNVSLVFKQVCNFANLLLPEESIVREAQQGECPFRNAHRTLCVLWDGSCTFCSLDYDGEVKLGNVFEKGIEAIWASEQMSRVRALMEHGILAEPLCRRCQGVVVRKPLRSFAV